MKEFEMEEPRIFISHSSSDKSFVSVLARELRAFDLGIWYDSWEIAAGDSIVDKVFEGLRESDTLLIVLSQASVVEMGPRRTQSCSHAKNF
jgi:hypothetical protein